MTAITLNLLAEEQLAQQERSRDPFKVALAVAIGVVALSVVAGMAITMAAETRGGKVTTLDGQLRTVQTPALLAEEAAVAQWRKNAEQILAVNQNRYLYAPQLALVKDLVPANVQLNRLQYSVATQVLEAPADPASQRPARPKVVERLTLRLDGKACSARPELDVDEFIKILRGQSAFSANIEQIQLRSIARGPVTADAKVADLPTAFFVIECTYQERQ